MNFDKPTYLKIAVPVPMRQYFDYLPPQTGNWQNLSPGMRILVPFQRRELVGVFVEFTQKPDVNPAKLKPITEILDNAPVLGSDLLEMVFWASDYYHYPIGEVFATAMPVLLRKGKPVEKSDRVMKSLLAKDVEVQGKSFSLNQDQDNAISSVNKFQNKFKVFLLNGVTGSGKTEVYFEAIKETLKNKKQVLVLVPEINLTPQTISRFQKRFTETVVAIHSNLTDLKRLNAWILARENQAAIIIGTRSAVFTSFKNLGLIVVDEEHDLSFKQQDGFRYNARDLAVMRAKINNIPIILGSATPSLESLQNAKHERYQELLLPKRAGSAKLPEFLLLDVKNKYLDHGLSKELLTEVKTHLANGDQVMLFLNRRGFAPVILCHSCGWMLSCKRCDKQMTYHHNEKRMHCHHCGAQKFVPKKCDNCNNLDLMPIGLGTERIEDVLQKELKDFAIARIDKDTTKHKGSIEKLLNGINDGEYQILIGTQMLAKGHHFPNVTLVGVIGADGGFFSSDFRALERMGQLLLQVSGRAGRDEKPGKVMVQTHYPDHPLLLELFEKGYNDFAISLLEERQAALLPPFASFALFRAEAFDVSHAHDFLESLKNLNKVFDASVQVLGPIPASMPRRAGRHRMQLLVQAKKRIVLQEFLRNIMPKIDTLPNKHKIRWSLDVDPLEML